MSTTYGRFMHYRTVSNGVQQVYHGLGRVELVSHGGIARRWSTLSLVHGLSVFSPVCTPAMAPSLVYGRLMQKCTEVP